MARAVKDVHEAPRTIYFLDVTRRGTGNPVGSEFMDLGEHLLFTA